MHTANDKTSLLRRCAKAAVVWLMAGGLGALLAAPPALGQLRICNKTAEAVTVAVGYMHEGEWTSMGWYEAKAGRCATPVSGTLRNRYYYVRAESGSGKTWGDNHTFCTHETAFTIRGDKGCRALGYDAERFFQIDTGNRAQWTQNLVLADSGGGQRRDGSGTDERRDGVAALVRGWRGSHLEDGTQVLVLRNRRSVSVDFHLTCYTRSNASKTLFVSVPARSTEEIGFMEGWPGNFVYGERCEARYKGELLWREPVPRQP